MFGISLRGITLTAFGAVLSLCVGCAQDIGLPKCVFADNPEWGQVADQPPDAAAMLQSIQNTPIDPARLATEEANFHWFRSKLGQVALCYHSDPFCSPRQFTFLRDRDAYAATEVEYQMCT
jgi:hypothetical protein